MANLTQILDSPISELNKALGDEKVISDFWTYLSNPQQVTVTASNDRGMATAIVIDERDLITPILRRISYSENVTYVQLVVKVLIGKCEFYANRISHRRERQNYFITMILSYLISTLWWRTGSW